MSETQPNISSAVPRSYVLEIMYTYVLVAEAILLGLALHLYPPGGAGTPGPWSFESLVAGLVPAGWQEAPLLATYMGGLLAFAAAYLLPERIAGGKSPKLRVQGIGKDHPLARIVVPFTLRVCFLEACAVCGLIVAILTAGFYSMLPLWGLAVISTLTSMPTAKFKAAFLARLERPT